MATLSTLAKANGTITADTISNAETFTIAGKVYTCADTLLTTDGSVKIATTDALTLANLVAAINLDSGAGTTYATNMTVHPHVTATFDTDTATVVAVLPGTQGNLFTMATTSDSTTASALTNGSGNINTAINEIVAQNQLNSDTLTNLVQQIQGAAAGS